MTRANDRRIVFLERTRTLASSLEVARGQFLAAAAFGGPSLYFHLEALQARRQRDFHRLAEMIYATLVAWGMHRMGPGGAKMVEFDRFQSSLLSAIRIAEPLFETAPDQMTEANWITLKSVFDTIDVMASGASLVGRSKVMAHLLPELVAPIDRQYTLSFLGEKNRVAALKPDPAWEWCLFRDVLEGFFYPLVARPDFQLAVSNWRTESGRLASSDQRQWETSDLKWADNLVIGLVYPRLKAEREQRKAKAALRRSRARTHAHNRYAAASIALQP